MRVLTLSLALFCLSQLAGCAVGNTYDYRYAVGGVPVTGADGASVAVSVVDQRSYVLSGNKPAKFIGLQRGGFGNPFDVTTTSGAPLADDLTAAISGALAKQGYRVVDDSTSAWRSLELRLDEWKTDVAMRMKVLYDLVLTVRDAQGTTLATATAEGSDALGGGMEAQNAANAAAHFELVFTRLLSEDDVQRALRAP